MTRSIRVAAVALALLGGALPARALDIDFGAAVNLGDDASIFVNVSSGYFHREPAVVERYVPRFRDPDDLAVNFFLAARAGRDPQIVLQLRSRGLSWLQVSHELGVPVDVWFVPVAHDPGPPYGKAYGYWKKHRREPQRVVLTDADCRNLVAVRMMHEYYGIPVERAMDLRAAGTRLPRLVGDEYRTRHGKGKGKGGDTVAGPTKAKSSGKSGKGGKPDSKGGDKGNGKH